MIQLLLSCLVLTASSTPFNSTDTVISQAPLVNGTTGLIGLPVVPVDPRFSYDWIDMPHYFLSEKQLIAAATDTMAKLAAMDFNGQIGSFQSSPVPRVPLVIRFRVLSLAQRVDTRFAVWAVYGLVAKMAKVDGYVAEGMKLKWNDVPVATIKITEVYTVSSQLTLEQRSNVIIPQISSDDLPYLQFPTDFPTAGTDTSLGNADLTDQQTDNFLPAGTNQSLGTGNVTHQLIANGLRAECK